MTTLVQFIITFAYPLVAGMVLGLIYFGGLWMVLRRLPEIKHPAAWLGLSLVVRMLIVLLVLYLLFADSWQQLIMAVLGMLTSRAILVHRIKPGPWQNKKANRATP